MSRSVAKCLPSLRVAKVSNLSITRNQAAFHGPTAERLPAEAGARSVDPALQKQPDVSVALT